jgi:hypothetical protein
MRCQTLGKAAGSLERSGMDPIGDLVVAGGLSAVLAQDHDRFAREPAYLSYLREAFGQHGCKLRALNDGGNDSPEGQLTDSILDQIARFERLKIAEGIAKGPSAGTVRSSGLASSMMSRCPLLRGDLERPRSLASRARKAYRRRAPACTRKPIQGSRGVSEEALRGIPKAQRLPGPACRGAHHLGRATF